MGWMCNVPTCKNKQDENKKQLFLLFSGGAVDPYFFSSNTD